MAPWHLIVQQYQVHNPSNLCLFQEIILFVLRGKPRGNSYHLHWGIIKIIQNLTSLSCWNSCSSERNFFKTFYDPKLISPELENKVLDYFACSTTLWQESQFCTSVKADCKFRMNWTSSWVAISGKWLISTLMYTTKITTSVRQAGK